MRDVKIRTCLWSAVKSPLAILTGCILFPFAGNAQEPPLPQPSPSVLIAGFENLGESLLITDRVQFEAGSIAEPLDAPLSPITGGEDRRRGRWRISPHLQVRGTYDDNIFIQPKNEVADYILTVSPGLGVGFWDSDEEREAYLDRQRVPSFAEKDRGTFLFVDYTAILLGFARTSSQNAFDHDGRLAARWEREKLTLGASARFESKSETNADIGGRVRRKTLSAAVTSAYQLTEKTALELAFFAIENDPEDFVRTTEWRVEAAAEYAVTPLVRLALGTALGRVDADGESDTTFERVFARARYALTEKVEAELRGGVEFRQSDGFAGDRATPIFELAVDWTPRAGTQLALEAYHRVETSMVLLDQDLTRTGGALIFRQALRGGCHFGLEGGAHLARYTATADEGPREDQYFYLRPGLFYNFAPWGSAGVSIEYRRNHSDRSEFDFDNVQSGVEIALYY